MARKDIPTLRSFGDIELLVQFLKLASIITRPMQSEVAARNGVSVNELRVLMCLSGEGAVAGSEIAFLMSMTPMNVSRALNRLKRLGWIERVASKDNRRRKPVQMSAAGWKAYSAMLPDIRTVAQRLFASLDRTERWALASAFDRMIGEVDAWDAEEQEEKSAKRAD